MSGNFAKVPPSKASSTRLTTTLALVGALAGLLIVVGYSSTLDKIEANRAATIDRAIQDVLSGIDRYETLYLHDDSLTATPPAETAGHHAPEKVYAGYSADGRLVGFAIVAKEPGFQEQIEILFGYDPGTRKTLGLSILMSRETPGLGDKIQGSTWRRQFRDRLAPIIGTKKGAASGPSDVDMVTGATISSRAVIGAVNKSAERWAPILAAYVGGGRS
jgi:Na+-translocating ferredoxin:NAD+ oxidoreductase subunit G